MNSKVNNTFFTLPNIITLMRIILIPFFLIMIISGRVFEALLVFSIAGATDALDGQLARLWHQKTKIGALLDPAADKLLVTTAYIALSLPALNSPNVIPLWLTATIIGRDVLIVSGASIAYIVKGQKSFPPFFLGKVSLVCQVGTIFLVLLLNCLHISPLYLTWVYYLTLIFTFLSGIHYTAFYVNLHLRPQKN